MKVYVPGFLNDYPTDVALIFQWYDETTMTFVYQNIFRLPKDNSITNTNAAIAAVKANVYATAAAQGYSITDGDIITPWPVNGFPSGIRTFNNPTRSLNTAFQISTTQDAQVSYAVDIAATLSLTTGQTGTVTLQYADDSGFTTNVVTVQSSVNGNTGTLAIGLGLTQTATASLSGTIPTGKYVRLLTANTTGTPTFTFRTAQEVLQ